MGVLQPDEDQAGDHSVDHLLEDNRDHDVVDLLKLMKKWIWEMLTKRDFQLSLSTLPRNSRCAIKYGSSLP